MFALTALLQACADAPAAVDPAGAEAAALTENPNVSLVDERTQKLNDYFLGLPNWPTRVEVSLEVDMGKDSTDIGGGLLVCSVKQVDVKKNFDDIILIGANSGVMYPGAMIQGETLDDGTLSPLNLARSPLHVSIDMGVVDADRHVENPNSATVQAAIAELQREADDRLGSHRPRASTARTQSPRSSSPWRILGSINNPTRRHSQSVQGGKAHALAWAFSFHVENRGPQLPPLEPSQDGAPASSGRKPT